MKRPHKKEDIEVLSCPVCSWGSTFNLALDHANSLLHTRCTLCGSQEIFRITERLRNKENKLLMQKLRDTTSKRA